MTPLANPFLLLNKDGVEVQHPDDASWIFNVSKNGCLDACFLQFDADLSVIVNLNNENAKCDLKCIYLTNKNNKININIQVLHKSKKTISKQQIKGLATDQAQVNFNGQIVIPKNSQNCDGMQSHRGILLSDKAVISATPQLEIWADDVKCAHGSAIGPLPHEQLFYLETRGVDKASAQKLLLSSFFNDIIPDDFEQSVQQWMDENV
ncbi:MAG: SufD family Fe-S cluster assembly protein [Alphaproteobacteria bacterium]|nr:SufD family Fe-S cluster assembly protein [Alphaproteobacteria bacterium]